MIVWHFAGDSGLGKTVLLEALITQLPGTTRVLKHSHHLLEGDAQGSDTDRLSQAATTVRLHQDGIVLRGRHPKLSDFVTWYASQGDHLLIEGLKFLNTPKIYLSQTAIAPHIRVGTVIGPSPPSSLDTLWIASALPLTAEKAHGIACTLASKPTGAGFSWDILQDALGSLD